MDDICDENRFDTKISLFGSFELIRKYKHKLVDSTNICRCPDEMAVIDRTLFRFWQMGWLDILETYTQLHNANTDKYIDANELLDHFNNYDVIRAIDIREVLEAIKEFPAADAKPAIIGHWVLDADGNTLCDVCAYYPENNNRTNYCPGCGAKMERGNLLNGDTRY